MKKYVFTVKEDICNANNKDVNATELLSIMSHYGTVVDYDRDIAVVKAEYQAAIDNLNAQLGAIKEQELTADEIAMIKAYRDNKNVVVAQFTATIKSYEETLVKFRADYEAKIKKIIEVVGE
jgi:hypothetical protein